MWGHRDFFLSSDDNFLGIDRGSSHILRMSEMMMLYVASPSSKPAKVQKNYRIKLLCSNDILVCLHGNLEEISAL